MMIDDSPAPLSVDNRLALQERCACGCIRQRHAATLPGVHIGKCNGFQKDITGKKYACPCVEFHVNMMPQVTEQQIIDGWAKWGDGTVLKPEFVTWLTGQLNQPIPFKPMVVDGSGYNSFRVENVCWMSGVIE